jgi:glycosyltransferase involved in cell wall biosynthesis
MKVVALTTSYPRDTADTAGAFVRAAVEQLRSRGIDVEVVSPASFRHFGIAYGHGIIGNLQHAPWKVVLLPLFLFEFARAARRAARDADLVHAHWLPSGFAALATGKPFIVQLWGTDVELARRARWLFRPILRRARLTVCASTALAEAARKLGAGEVRVIPSGVAIPSTVGMPDEPPHALYISRLSEEKGVLELAEAARGLPLVVVGDGPLRAQLPQALGFVPPAEVGGYLERATVVVCPSRREGYSVIAREAMAHGRPVIATSVGGLTDAVIDGETGVLVPPRDVPALRAALQRLLADPELCRRLGTAAKHFAEERFGLDTAALATIEAYKTVQRGDE